MAKLRRKVERDEAARLGLEASGWNVQVIWECQCRNDEALKSQLTQILSCARVVNPSLE